MKLQFITSFLAIIHQNIALPNDDTTATSSNFGIQRFFDCFARFGNNDIRYNRLPHDRIMPESSLRNENVRCLSGKKMMKNYNMSPFMKDAAAELLRRRSKIKYRRNDEWETLYSLDEILWPFSHSFGNTSQNEYLQTLLSTKNCAECFHLRRQRAEDSPSTSTENQMDGINMVELRTDRFIYAQLRLENAHLRIHKIHDRVVIANVISKDNEHLSFNGLSIKGFIKLILHFTFPDDKQLEPTHFDVEETMGESISLINSQISMVSQTSNDTSNEIILFGGDDVEASMFVMNIVNEAELREQFEKWNIETISKWNNHEKIAFHITTIDSEEPKNSESLFREVFNDVKLMTRYLPANATATVFSLHCKARRGSIYAIVGFANKL